LILINNIMSFVIIVQYAYLTGDSVIKMYKFFH